MPSPRRILFVDHSTHELGGAEINLLELLSHPGAQASWESHVACAPGRPLATALAALSIRRHSYSLGESVGVAKKPLSPQSPMARLRAWRDLEPATERLHNIMDGLRPDAVISCTNRDHFAAGAAAQRLGIPSLWWVNEILSADFFSWPLRRLFAKRGEALATRLLPVSGCGRDALVREGISADRIRVVHNGVSLERYGRRSSTLWRERLKLQPGEPVIGIVGRVTPWKGQDVFLRLAKEWADQGRSGRFVVIGRSLPEDAKFDRALHAFVRKHGLSGRVEFSEFQPDMASVIAQLDVLVHCSTKPEPFGRVIIEAMAAGVPVIAAQVGGVPEIVTSGVNGGLAEPGDVDSYSSQLTALLSDPVKRAAWVSAGRKTVQSRFTLDREFADFERVLGEVRTKAT